MSRKPKLGILPRREDLKQIFIDLDDTLWFTAYNNMKSLEQLYHEYGWSAYYDTFEALFAIYKPHNDDLWQAYREGKITKKFLSIDRLRHPFVRHFQQDDQWFLQLNDRYMNIMTTQKVLIDGAIELLEYLNPKYQINILSNGFQEVQQAKMDNSGLSAYISRVILSDHIGVNKPDARLFQHAFEQANTTSQQSIMIGDSWEADIIGALIQGQCAVWFNPEQNPMPPIPTGLNADLITEVHHLNEIQHLI